MRKDVIGARKIMESYEGDLSRLQRQIETLAAENRALRAVVEKLPKTEDGAPIAPGMFVHKELIGDLHACGVVAGFKVRADGTLQELIYEDGFERCGKTDLFYSTEHAARLALEKGAGDGNG